MNRIGIDPPPDMLLGPEHPLVRVLERQRLAIARSIVVGALLAAGLAALIAGLAAALALVVAAAIVELVLVTGVAGLSADKRTRVLELISAGGGELPIAAVEQASARLSAPDARRRLARDLDALRAEAARPLPMFPMPRTTFNPRVIAAVAPTLEEIAVLLQAEHPGLPGIALLERMLGDGTSSLYGDSAELLRQDLRRVRYLLA
jgi:hypothetical protein